MNAQMEDYMTTFLVNWTPKAVDIFKLILRFMGL